MSIKQNILVINRANIWNCRDLQQHMHRQP